MPPDPQRNAWLQAKINFPISGKHRFFLLVANTLMIHNARCHHNYVVMVILTYFAVNFMRQFTTTSN
jgi:uncharacterized membrane protein